MTKTNSSVASPSLKFHTSQEVEDLVFVIRAHKQAVKDMESFPRNATGAVCLFPAAFNQEFDGTVHCWTASTSVEIGSILSPGRHIIDLSLKTYTSSITGSFLVYVSSSPTTSCLEEAEYIDLNDSDDSLLSQMPTSRSLLAKNYVDLKAEVNYMGKKAVEAKEKLHEMFLPFFYKEAGRVSRRLEHEEALAVCHLALESLLARYASKNRPKSSFKFALVSEVKRNLKRFIAHQSGETIQVAQLRSILWHNSEIESEDELKKAAHDNVSDYSVKEAIRGKAAVSLYAEEIAHLLPVNESRIELQVVELYDKLKKFALVAGLNEEQAEAWVYRLGGFDEPHTLEETTKRFGITFSEYRAIEYKLLSVFSTSGRTVTSVANRKALKHAIKKYLLEDSITISRSWMASMKVEN